MCKAESELTGYHWHLSTPDISLPARNYVGNGRNDDLLSTAYKRYRRFARREVKERIARKCRFFRGENCGIENFPVQTRAIVRRENFPH